MPLKLLKVVLFFLVCAVLAACSGYSVTGGPGKTVNPSLMTSIGRGSDLLGINSLFIAPVRFDVTARQAEEKKSELLKVVRDAAFQHGDLALVGYDDALKASRASGTQDQDMFALAQARGADSLCQVTVHEYQDRLGSAVGADETARVAFSMEIIRLKDRRSVWKGDYHFSDQALSENLFNVKKRLEPGRPKGWRGANELMEGGITAAWREFSEKRTQEFSREKA